MANAVGEMARNITNLSSVAGIGVEQFQEMAFAADRVGISQEKFADILKDVNDKVGDFLSTGAGPMKDFFEQIAPKVGVTADQFRNLNSADALQLYVSSLEKANLSQAEMTFYMEAIASDATALLPLLRDNGTEMARFGQAAEDAGKVIDQSMIEAAINAQETWSIAIAKLQGMFTNLAIHVANSFDEVFGITTSSQVNQLETLIQDTTEEIIRLGEELKGAEGTPFGAVTSSQILKLNEDLARYKASLAEIQGMQGGGAGEVFGPPAPPGVPTQAPIGRPTNYGGRSPLEQTTDAAQELAASYKEVRKSLSKADEELQSFGASASTVAPNISVLSSEADRLASIGDTLQSSMEGAFMSMIDGTATAEDAFRSMAKDIISELYRVLVVQQLVGQFEPGGGGILGGIFGAVMGRASGGPVSAGKPYMVGEHGRELFVPQSAGRVLSVAQTKNAGSFGGVVINQEITVNQGGADIPPERLFREIRVAATDAVADAMQRGGGFRGVMSS